MVSQLAAGVLLAVLLWIAFPFVWRLTGCLAFLFIAVVFAFPVLVVLLGVSIFVSAGFLGAFGLLWLFFAWLSRS